MLLRLYPELKGKIITVHNGIDIQNFQKNIIHFSSQHKIQLRDKLFNADLKDFIILSVAALHERKGLKYLIEGFTKVLEHNPKSKLIIVGEGPERKKLEKLIKSLNLDNDVLLIGEQKNIAKILKSSDLFVLPSIKEAFGLVLVEAMAVGLPVIGTNTGGIPEIIENNKCGRIVEPENSNELAKTIIELMDNAPIRQKLAYVGHHHVKKFDVTEMVKKTEEIYDAII
jgi:glycosyltransferase involved in cell wall biosynthesis